ncbi:helix-turn-helix domain-containing protein [Azorhizobium caulinodans]|uniref:helix-turn-helix domain-containing protein n=1 Tax=Azorhizobium caulinodans TaxID=7 RepID=UPI002FBE1C2F
MSALEMDIPILPAGVKSAADLPAYYARNRRKMFAAPKPAPTKVFSAPPPSSKEIRRIVCAHFGILEDQVTGPGRTLEVVRVRHIAMYLSVKLTSETSLSIGRTFNRDRSTVLQAAKSLAEILALEPRLISDIEALWDILDRRVDP